MQSRWKVLILILLTTSAGVINSCVEDTPCNNFCSPYGGLEVQECVDHYKYACWCKENKVGLVEVDDCI